MKLSKKRLIVPMREMERRSLSIRRYQEIQKRELYFVREQKEFLEKFEKLEGEENMNEIILKEDKEKGSFEIREGEKLLAELNFRKLSGNRVEAYHTFVDDSLRGQGIAEKLYQNLLSYVKEYHYTVVPTCSYIEKRIQKDPIFLATNLDKK